MSQQRGGCRRDVDTGRRVVARRGRLALAAGAPALRPLCNLQKLSGFDVCVCQQVGLQVGPLVEMPLTDGTLDGRLFQVEDPVDGERPRLTEPFAALVALEGLLLGVDVPVVPQVVLSPEGLVADITGVRPLIGVSALVDQQVVGLGELPLAELADEPLLWPG